MNRVLTSKHQHTPSFYTTLRLNPALQPHWHPPADRGVPLLGGAGHGMHTVSAKRVPLERKWPAAHVAAVFHAAHGLEKFALRKNPALHGWHWLPTNSNPGGQRQLGLVALPQAVPGTWKQLATGVHAPQLMLEVGVHGVWIC